MRVKSFSTMMSTNGNDDNHLFCNSKMMFFVWMVLLVGLLVTISPLIASEPGEILGPESGYMDLRWRSDDKVVAIQSDNEYFPDKLHYTHGEIVTVKYDIRVDTSSRGYKPNRTYYLLSPYVTGYQIKGDGDDNYWFIVKSDIDTLETITDDRSLKGEFTLQLLRYKEKPDVIEDNKGSLISLTPIDTTHTKSSKHSGPPRFSIEVVRVAEVDRGENVYLHSSGKFYFDQLSGFGFQGKVESEFWKNRFNHNSDVIAPNNDSFLPPQPSFRELARGGAFSTPINVLKNSTLKWNINLEYPVVISSVELVGNTLGCSVSVNPANNEEYILTTGNLTGSVIVRFYYTLNGISQSGTNTHTIISYYNFHGYVTYNHKDTQSDLQRTAFIGRVILWGKNSSEEIFEIIAETSLTSSSNGYLRDLAHLRTS